MGLAADVVGEVIGQLMSTAVDLELAAPVAVAAVDAERVVEGAVQITGAWLGVVVLRASETLASRCAQRMLDLGDTPPAAGEMEDAFGELVNMVGGKIKTLMAETGAQLSLPVVVRGYGASVKVPGTRQLGRFEFSCDGQPLIVTVLERSAGT